MNKRGKVVGEFVLIVVGVFVALTIETMMSECHDGDLVPTGFPPCDLQGIDLEHMTALFEPLCNDASFQNTLTYRHSELGVMLRLFRQQVAFADNVLDHVRD